MNNILVSIKRFLTNKNTVTILGVIIIIAILYFGYNYQIEKSVTPVRNIPIAKQTIQPRTLITEDMIDYIDVAPIVLQEGVIRYKASIVGKYSNYNTTIPQGSMFYNGVVVSEEEMPDDAFAKVKEGEIPYLFSVNMTTTYGNSMFPGNKIDIYMKAEDEDGKIMVGKLVENIEILAVKDSSGKNVFENTEEDRVPAFLIFGVSERINILLRKASYMSNYSVILIPVPHGGNAPETEGTQVSTIYLEDFINSHTVVIEEEEVEAPEVEDPDVEDLG